MNTIILLIFILGVAVGIALAWLYWKKRAGQGVISEQIEKKEKNKKKIIELLKNKEQITNDEVEKMLKVSNATAERYLDELEKEGYLRQVGRTGRSVYYKRPKP